MYLIDHVPVILRMAFYKFFLYIKIISNIKLKVNDIFKGSFVN